MMKGIALDLHIVMSTFDIISCVQFPQKNVFKGLQLIMLIIVLWSVTLRTLELSHWLWLLSHWLWLPGNFVISWPVS